MKLNNKAIETLIADRAIRQKLGLELDFTEVWIDKLIEKNKENGPLTTVKALQVIEKETGLSQEQILEAEVASSQLGE